MDGHVVRVGGARQVGVGRRQQQRNRGTQRHRQRHQHIAQHHLHAVRVADARRRATQEARLLLQALPRVAPPPALPRR